MKTLTFVATLTVLCASQHAQGQWARTPDKLIPRTPAGAPDLFAPAPRAADGKPNLSGIWLPDSDPLPAGAQTVEGDLPFPRHMINIAADLEPGDVQLRPWAEELLAERLANRGTDSPIAYCKPTGVPWINAVALPYEIVQTRDVVIILYEENTVFRQIFLDERTPVEDPLPRWMGYSTGRWDGDTLVVETIGLTEESWLDGMGHPHSDAMRVVERFRRRDAGHLEIETTVDDPATYSEPITYTVAATAMPDGGLLEYFCTENEKSSAHYQ